MNKEVTNVEGCANKRQDQCINISWMTQFLNTFRRNPDSVSREELQQKISPAQVVFMAVSCGIGTGLLVSSGQQLSTAGPAGVLISYTIVGSMLYCCMQSTAEIVTAFPSLPGGFNSYGNRFIDPSLGFSVSWIFALQWLCCLPLEIVCASMVIKFWLPNANVNGFVSIFLVLLIGLNLFGASLYATADLVFNTIKLITIVGFIILSVVLISHGPEPTGFSTYKNTGAFSAVNPTKAICTTLVSGAFALGGTEFIALTAAEQKKENIAKTMKYSCYAVAFRIITMFLLTLLLIGCLVPYNSPFLMGSGADNVTHSSPFVVALQMNGVRVVPHIINAVILIAVLSVGNAAVYSSSRTLLSLAKQGFAPSCLDYIDQKGRPMMALGVSCLFGLLSYLASYKDQEAVFIWLMSISGLSAIFTWSTICISHIRFRRAMYTQNKNIKELGYKAQTGIAGSYYALTINLCIMICQFWTSMFPIGANKPDVVNFLKNAMALPVAIVLYTGHKLYSNGWFLFIASSEIDIDTSRELYITQSDSDSEENDKDDFVTIPLEQV